MTSKSSMASFSKGGKGSGERDREAAEAEARVRIPTSKRVSASYMGKPGKYVTGQVTTNNSGTEYFVQLKDDETKQDILSGSFTGTSVAALKQDIERYYSRVTISGGGKKRNKRTRRKTMRQKKKKNKTMSFLY